MADWSTWDVIVLLAAGYVASMALVRLMRNHRDKIVSELQQQWELEQQRKEEEERLERKQKARDERKRQDEERRKRRTSEAA